MVDYRLEPYSQEEGALDVARAVRFVRKNAKIYQIDPDDIAVMGFSAGGIQAGEFLMHYDENVATCIKINECRKCYRKIIIYKNI